MKLSQGLFATFVLVASMCVAAPVQAELLVNEWEPFEFPVAPDPNCPTEDTAFYVQGMQHLKASNLRKGGLAINMNALGTFTGIQTGEEWHWRHNIADVLPIYEGNGENEVFTYQETLKLIGQGGTPSYFAKTKFHIIVFGGEVKSYIDAVEVRCK
jgi:hypothetical protein